MDLIFYMMFNFIVYSFIGWIIEEAYSFAITKKFKKEGFLIGPFKPMYGIAVTLLILCNEILGINGVSLILLCFLIPTTVEYISGYMLKHIFNKIYWDYSYLKYNIHGFVSLRFSFYWMLLSFTGLHLFHNILYNLYIEREGFFRVISVLGFTVLGGDFYLTLKRLTNEMLKKA
jgi:uncharacterized membrane protein